MLKTPEKIRMPTVSGGQAEVICNWSEGVKGEFLKLRVNDEEVIIPRSSLSKVAMWLATEEEQDAMIPTKSINVRTLKKVVTIQLQKRMEPGEMLHIPVEFKIPLNKDFEVPIIHK